MKTKSLSRPFELKSLDEEGKFSGYGSVFDVTDAYGDVVEKGAFKGSLEAWAEKGKSPAMLWQHRPGQPIGKWTRMHEDDHGLMLEGQLALKTQTGAEAYELLKMGAISGLSIGYSIPKGGGEWDEKAGVFRLKQVSLWEVSLVTFPANESAQVETVKTTWTVREIEHALRDAGVPKALAIEIAAVGAKKALDQRDADEADAEAKHRQLIERLRALRGE